MELGNRDVSLYFQGYADEHYPGLGSFSAESCSGCRTLLNLLIEGKDKPRQLDEEYSACYTLLGQAYVLGWGMEEDESRTLEEIRLV